MGMRDVGLSFDVDPSPHIFDPMKHSVTGKTTIKVSQDFIHIGISHASISGLYNTSEDVSFGNRDGITFVDIDKVISMSISSSKGKMHLASIDFDVIHDNCVYMARYALRSDKSYPPRDILISFDDLGDKFVFLFADFSAASKRFAFPGDKKVLTNVTPYDAATIVGHMKKNILM